MAEIGIFFKTVTLLEREDKKEALTHLWLGSNIQYKGLKEILAGMSSVAKEEPTVGEVNNDWKRLASFMIGKK